MLGRGNRLGAGNAAASQQDWNSQKNPRNLRSQAWGHGVQADPRTMAKMVECVPNFSEGCNKEVRVEGWAVAGGGQLGSHTSCNGFCPVICSLAYSFPVLLYFSSTFPLFLGQLKSY